MRSAVSITLSYAYDAVNGSWAPRVTCWHGPRGATVAKTRTDDDTGITPELILSTALELVEADGIGGLSMRKLAAELGVAPPTIYWHIGNKHELLDRLLDHVTAELGQVRPRGTTPKKRIASVVRSLRRQMARRPQVVSLAYTQGRGSAIYGRAQETLERELRRAGVADDAVLGAMRTLLLHVGGFILLDRALPQVEAEGTGGRVTSADVDDSFEEILDAVLERVLGATSSG